MGTRSEEPARRSQRELQKRRTQAKLLEVRTRLRAEMGRDPTKGEIAKAAGVAPGLVTRYWDRIGTGELPEAYLERLKSKIAARPANEPPLVALGQVLLDFIENLALDEVEVLRREVTAQSASPEEEVLRYQTLNVLWRPVLADALAQRRRRLTATEEEDKAVARFIVIILDAASRWQERNFEGDVAIPTREAVGSAIPALRESPGRSSSPRRGKVTPAVEHDEAVQIRIEASNLPGSSCGPSPDSPGGYHNIHVAVQRRNRRDELLGLVPGDAPSATWTFDCTAAVSPTGVDLKGPYIQGPPGGRFIYLSWGTVDDAGTFTLFRRAKLWLDAIPSGVTERAMESGLLVGRLGLTDGKGNPLCAAVRPPGIEWSALPSS